MFFFLWWEIFKRGRTGEKKYFRLLELALKEAVITYYCFVHQEIRERQEHVWILCGPWEHGSWTKTLVGKGAWQADGH